MNQRFTLFGAAGSGSVPVEAALTLIGQPYDLIEAATCSPSWVKDDPSPQVPDRPRGAVA